MTAFNCFGFVFIVLRSEAVFFVKYAYALFEYDSLNLAFGVFNNFFRTPTAVNFNTVLFCLFDFILGSGHFFTAFKAEH